MDNNYTRPDDDEHIDSPHDWLAGALLFARTLSLMLEINEGIVVAISGDMKEYYDDDFVIVANNGSQITVSAASEYMEEADCTFKEGDMITFHEKKPKDTNG